MSLFASSSTSSIPRRQLLSSLTATSTSSTRRTFFTTPSPRAKPRRSQGLNPFDEAGWEMFRHDDIPTIGHLLLNRQRQLLAYLRLVKHEFPNLEKLRQRYVPPPTSNILQFRQIHFQGMPKAANCKSVLKISMPELYRHEIFTSLPDERTRIRVMRKFLHLAGSRWNPGKGPIAEPFRIDGNYGEQVTVRGEVKISCQRFPTERQNSKWCSDVFDAMIEEAKNLDDGIADLPIDLRHSVIREHKLAHHGRRRKANIGDWPAQWPTPVDISRARGEAAGKKEKETSSS